jgi:hypothetical protein
MPNGQRLLAISAHGHGGGEKKSLLGDANILCEDEITTFPNITAVFLGGDLPGLLVNQL